jgi:peptide/nickel transport system ATP-binding protein
MSSAPPAPGRYVLPERPARTPAGTVRIAGPVPRKVADGNNVVDVKGVDKTFMIPGRWPWSPTREVAAVRSVNFSVKPGEIVALIGQSGSGKTTVSRMVLGLENPTKGEIWLDGQRWDDLSERARREKRVHYQYVPQDALSALDPQQTALEHVIESLTILGKREPSAAEAEAHRMLDKLGLSHRLHALPREMSGGEQRRVTLARVFALQPHLVVADEPTSGLDPDRQESVLEDLIHNLPPKAGCILVTHEMTQARKWCHRGLVMLEGRVIEEILFPDGQPQHPYAKMLFDPWGEHDFGMSTAY